MAASAAEFLAADHVGGQLYDSGCFCEFLGRAGTVACWSSLVLPLLDRRLSTQHSLHPTPPLPHLATAAAAWDRDHGLFYLIRAVDRGPDCHQRATVGAERERE